MSCDINLTLEKSVGDKWVCVDTFGSHYSAYAKLDDLTDGFSKPAARSQNYRRFAALAGVRGDGPKPRGVPADVSDTTRYLIHRWDCDGHSHSWLPLNEAVRIFLNTQCVPEGKTLPEFIAEYPESHFFNIDCSQGSGENADDYRVVFWFDN